MCRLRRVRGLVLCVSVLAAAGCSTTTTSSEARTRRVDPGPCYVGDWLGTESAMRTMLGVGGQPSANVSGAVVLTFLDEGTFAYAFEELGTDLDARGRPTDLVLNGTVAGTYTASATAFVITPTESDVTVTVGGRSQQADIELGANDRGNGMVGESPYSCRGDVLTLTGSNDGKVTTWERIGGISVSG
jgi:hypothetical protein